jgi:hypothetical protein
MPIGALVFAAVLAVGHHALNHWLAKDGRTVYNSLIQPLLVLSRLTYSFLVHKS